MQEVPLAELYGLWQCLRHCLPPIHYHTDCRWVSDGFIGGRQATAGGTCVFADVWAAVWSMVDDIGESNVACSWIKGHASLADVDRKVIKGWQRLGNLGQSAHGRWE